MVRASSEEKLGFASLPKSGKRISFMQSPDKVPPARHKVRHRKVKQGHTIFKGHPSWNIMMNLKLGIAYTVGRLPESNRPLKSDDFRSVFKQVFAPQGTPITPAHSASVFSFKDHAPLAFRHLREHFGVSDQEYVLSISGEHSLRELGTPGKSGAVFYLTEDYKFLLKTISKKESKFLRRMLPNYYAHVMNGDQQTLLPRFFGLIRITTAAKRNIRMVVMNNLLPEETPIHEKYDLKGSTLGRYATPDEKNDPNVTLKDLDFRHKLRMPLDVAQAFWRQLETDCSLLRALRIMDYSLLAMLHFPSRVEADEGDEDEAGASPRSPSDCGTPRERMEAAPGLTTSTMSTDTTKSIGTSGASSSSTRPASVASSLRSTLGTAPATVLDARDDSDSDDGDEPIGKIPQLTDEELAAAYTRSRSRQRVWAIGDGLRAVAEVGGEGGQQEPVYLFCGVIDILQQYGIRKKLEHRYKVIRYAGDRAGISVTDPNAYAERFFNFISALVRGIDASRADVQVGPGELKPATAPKPAVQPYLNLGDRIVAVNGTRTKEHEDATRLLREARGTVTILIQPVGKAAWARAVVSLTKPSVGHRLGVQLADGRHGSPNGADAPIVYGLTPDGLAATGRHDAGAPTVRVPSVSDDTPSATARLTSDTRATDTGPAAPAAGPAQESASALGRGAAADNGIVASGDAATAAPAAPASEDGDGGQRGASIGEETDGVDDVAFAPSPALLSLKSAQSASEGQINGSAAATKAATRGVRALSAAI